MSHCLANHFTGEDGQLSAQIIYYDAGVGTAMGLVESKWSGFVGSGLDENVCEAYNFLVANYNEGDEIFFFGFSRGAYTVRAAAGLVCNVGICKPTGMSQFWEMYAMYKAYPGQDLQTTPWAKRLPEGVRPSKFTVKVKDKDTEFMTESGWSWMANSRRDVDVKPYGFHDTSLHKEIKNAFQALALDEHRKPFGPSIWSLPEGSSINLVQCWFPGSHVNSGGGSDDGLGKKKGDLECMANTTFAWTVDRCIPFLAFDNDGIGQIMWDYITALQNIVEIHRDDARYGGWGSSGPLHNSYSGIINTMWGSKIRTPGEYFDPKLTGECIHPVVWHAQRKDNYHPPSLEGFKRIAAKDGQPAYWVRPGMQQIPPAGLASTVMSYIPGFGSKTEPKTVPVKIPEFVIPKRNANASDNQNLGLSIERALILNAGNRLPLGLSEAEHKVRERDNDKEGIQFLEELDKGTAE